MASKGMVDASEVLCKQDLGKEENSCKEQMEENKKSAAENCEDEEKLFHYLRHISKTVVHVGEWGDKPRDFAECKVKVTDVSFDAIDLDQSTFYFNHSFNGTMKIGEADCDLDRLLEICVQCMFVGETSQFLIELTTKPLCRAKYELNPSIKGTVKCTVQLQELHNDELFFGWSKEKKLTVAAQYKEKGIELFHNRRILDSFIRFSKAFKIVVTLGPVESLSRSLLDKDILLLRVNLLNNMASCQLHQKNFEHVISLCQKVLKVDPDNVKALYRQAVAYKELQNYEIAEDSLKTLLKIEPNNTAAKEKLQEVRKDTKEMNERYAILVKNMFR